MKVSQSPKNQFLHLPPSDAVQSQELIQAAGRFIDLTEPLRIDGFAHGANLSELVLLASKTIDYIRNSNPILTLTAEHFNSAKKTTLEHAKRWELLQISKIKLKVKKAMHHKHHYYTNTWRGFITALFLRCLGLWNKGRTAAIASAEDFLLYWDFRLPLVRQDVHSYSVRSFWPVNTQMPKEAYLYNYTPSHTIFINNLPKEPLRSLPCVFVQCP